MNRLKRNYREKAGVRYANVIKTYEEGPIGPSADKIDVRRATIVK